MTKEELRDAYPGDRFKVEIGDGSILTDALVIRIDDYDKDGLPDNAYVFGRREATQSSILISVRPERLTFVAHDPRIQALLAGAKDNDMAEANKALSKAVMALQARIDNAILTLKG